MSSHSYLFKNINNLIGIVDELRDCGIEGKISLPRICVMGTQSSGKSTVLESIIGLDFLPRGEGVCTRRPLELRLHHLTKEGVDEIKPFAIFPEKSRENKIYDFHEVRKLINEYTDEIAGQKKNIVASPIILSIYSASCPDLTVIDLPGITRIPLKDSDQPKNIEEITKNMTLKYITDPRTIILAVIPANIDLSTSDALKMAMEIDKEGKRTLGVITKIDIMDDGTNALKTLKNEEIVFAHGFVGVKNRSQKDINSNVSIQDALKTEDEFFKNHKFYKNLPNCGTAFLSQKLTKLLLEHITDQLPSMEKEIDEELKKVEFRLVDLGEKIPSEPTERQSLIIKLTYRLSEQIFESLEGRKQPSNNTNSLEFRGYSKMNIYFKDLSQALDNQEREFMTKIKTHDIWVTLLKFEGKKLTGFSQFEAFESIIKKNFDHYARFCLDTLEKVKLLLEDVVDEAINLIYKNYSVLGKEMKQFSFELMEERYEICKKFIREFLEHESVYYFTTNPFYSDLRVEMMEMKKEKQKQSPDKNMVPAELTYDEAFTRKFGYPNNLDYQLDRTVNKERAETKEKTEIERIERQLKINYHVNNKPQIEEFFWRLMCYVRVINRNIADSIPKAIISKLIFSFKNCLNEKLIESVLIDKKLQETLEEDKEVVEERSQMTELWNKLKSARKIFVRNIGKLHDS